MTPDWPVRDVNPDIPWWLEGIIQKLHAKDPAERFQSAKEVAELLGQCLAHVQQPTVAPLPAPDETRSKTVPRNKTITRSASKDSPASPWFTKRPGAAALIGFFCLACLVGVGAIVRLTGDRVGEKAASFNQPAANPASQNDNAAPSAVPDSPSLLWNDGADLLLRELDHDSAQLERRAEQFWDDSVSFPKTEPDSVNTNPPDKEPKP